MSMTNTDPGGGGLGTAGTMCEINPEDEKAIIGNLLSRLEKAEFALSQILGMNVAASNLSDISNYAGWIYGVEYMGVPGWIQTTSGTLIPPPGFTLSQSGFQMFNTCTGEYEDYHGVSTDSDGVIQFGFQANGQVSGCKVDDWNSGASMATPDAYMYQFQAGLSPNPYSYSKNINEITNEGISDSNGDNVAWIIEVELLNTGIFHVEVNAMWTLADTSGTFAITGNSSIHGGSDTSFYQNRGSYKDFSVLRTIDGNGLEYNSGFAAPLWYHTNANFFMTETSSRINVSVGNEVYGTPTLLGDRGFIQLAISIVKIGNLT